MKDLIKKINEKMEDFPGHEIEAVFEAHAGKPLRKNYIPNGWVIRKEYNMTKIETADYWRNRDFKRGEYSLLVAFGTIHLRK